jgi:hypothetical protein
MIDSQYVRAITWLKATHIDNESDT